MMVLPRYPRSSMWGVIFSCFLLPGLFSLGGRSQQVQNSLDPEEEKALTSIFNRWGISSALSKHPWNTTGNLCSEAALGDFNVYDDPNFNPGIICDCSFHSNFTCHLTRLKANDMGIVGPIPPELEIFKYLENLDLQKNYLTGVVPAFLGNFSAMKYLSLSFNSLSGSIPKELGKLQNLISLGAGINNFSGPLPPEFGNLSSLQKLYLDSVGATGEIPSTFSQLKKLTIMYLQDNSLVGKIPDFIGNFTNMNSLRLFGNSLQGPIPSSFGNLTQMNDLRIGNLKDLSSSLEFISDMKSLSILIVRDGKLSGNIPSNIGNYTKLNYLDLSFNNLTETLPLSLFSLNSLQSLFLGNNKLTGSLPDQKSPSLVIVDLSYNELSGTLPFWVSEKNLQLNLVANNFIIDKSNENVLPWGLNCLQNNIPCYRGSPTYSTFAINCGGDKIVTSSNGTSFEIDHHNLSSASYYVTDTKRWAVSSVGSFMGATNPIYLYSGPFNLTNVSNYEVFETARRATSSLRYYGLGLENGNYTVKLYFAETDITTDRTWKSTGRRMFDIYIQGNLKEKDFDIRKNADGLSLHPVVREYTTAVDDNFLEIHLFWAGKGTCCVPDTSRFGPLVSAVSVTPNFKPTVSNQPPITKKKNISLTIGIAIAVLAFLIMVVLIIGVLMRRRKMMLERTEGFTGLTAKPKHFSYAELKAATGNFSPSNKLGEGGFGSVFKGVLADGRSVAVKKLSEATLHGKSFFISEIETISTLRHRNLVNLYGYCCEGKQRLIVFEYMEHRSLDQVLFGDTNLYLDWPTRFEMCLGIAKGLTYLHEESALRIVHRDIKTSNILIDTDLKPKISDFGLAKFYDEKNTHMITGVAGTIGYLPPEYAMRGHLTVKVDVFAFGVLALEILCGRRNTDSSIGEEKMYLLEWVWDLHENKKDLEMIDPSLSIYDKDEAMRVIGVALLCTQAFTTMRPEMSRVVAMLKGDAEIPEVTSRPPYLAEWKFEDISKDSFSTIRQLATAEASSSAPSNFDLLSGFTTDDNLNVSANRS